MERISKNHSLSKIFEDILKSDEKFISVIKDERGTLITGVVRDQYTGEN